MVSRLLNLSNRGYYGCLFNIIFRDAFHDYDNSHKTHFTDVHAGGGGISGGSDSNAHFDKEYFSDGSKDSIEFSKPIIKTLATLISKSSSDENLDDGEDDSIDKSELLKAFNDVIIDLKTNAILSYFEMDFIDGTNMNIIQNSPFFKWYNTTEYSKLEKRQQMLHNEIIKQEVKRETNNTEELNEKRKELTDITESLEKMNRPVSKIHYVKHGGLLFNLYILQQKQRTNTLTHDENTMLLLLNKQYYSNLNKVNITLESTKYSLQIKQILADINKFINFLYKSPNQLDKDLYNEINELLNRFSYDKYTNDLEILFIKKITDIGFTQSDANADTDAGVGADDDTDADADEEAQETPIQETNKDLPSQGGKSSFNIHHYHKGGNSATKYNLYMNAIKHTIDRDILSNGVQRGGANAKQWYTLFKCFAYNFMGIRHDVDGALTQIAGAYSYHNYVRSNLPGINYPDIDPLNPNPDTFYNELDWFEFEKTTSMHVPGGRINEEVIRYVTGLFHKVVAPVAPGAAVVAPVAPGAADAGAPGAADAGAGAPDAVVPDAAAVVAVGAPGGPGVPGPPAGTVPGHKYGYTANDNNAAISNTIDDLTSIRLSSLPLIDYQNEKYTIRTENSINGVKFPFYEKSAIHLDLFTLLSVMFSTLPHGAPAAPAGADATTMKYIINNEATHVITQRIARDNVLTNYLSFCDPGPSGSQPNMIIDEFGDHYLMGVSGDVPEENKYELNYTPSIRTHIININSTQGEAAGAGAAAAAGTARYSFQRTPDNFVSTTIFIAATRGAQIAYANVAPGAAANNAAVNGAVAAAMAFLGLQPPLAATSVNSKNIRNAASVGAAAVIARDYLRVNQDEPTRNNAYFAIFTAISFNANFPGIGVPHVNDAKIGPTRRAIARAAVEAAVADVTNLNADDMLNDVTEAVAVQNSGLNSTERNKIIENAINAANSFVEYKWNKVTSKDVCITCACDFVTKYMERAVVRNVAPIDWKSINFFINDFGRRPGNGGGNLQARGNFIYPTITYNYDTPIDQPRFNAINNPNPGAAPVFSRLPIFYIFYSFLLFKGAGDIGQELTTLQKWGGISPPGAAPAAGAGAIPNPQPKSSTVDVTAALKFNNGTPIASANPRYVQFDLNGNAPRFLVSNDRPSGTRFILMMHYAVKTLLESNDHALCIRQNNINTLAFGGYVNHLYKSILAKVNNPLYFGREPYVLQGDINQRMVNSTKNDARYYPHINMLTENIGYQYGGNLLHAKRNKKHLTHKKYKHKKHLTHKKYRNKKHLTHKKYKHKKHLTHKKYKYKKHLTHKKYKYKKR